MRVSSELHHTLPMPVLITVPNTFDIRLLHHCCLSWLKRLWPLMSFARAKIRLVMS